jgi:hypothetical protein
VGIPNHPLIMMFDAHAPKAPPKLRISSPNWLMSLKGSWLTLLKSELPVKINEKKIIVTYNAIPIRIIPRATLVSFFDQNRMNEGLVFFSEDLFFAVFDFVMDGLIVLYVDKNTKNNNTEIMKILFLYSK